MLSTVVNPSWSFTGQHVTDSRPILLDLFCCAGGAARGYDRAGFRVVGVDIDPQPNYPYASFQADALDVLDALLRGWGIFGYDLSRIAAIHASPPCQRFATLVHCRPGVAETYPDLIEPVRNRLKMTGKPWVIENVMGAPLDPTAILCGTQFGRRFRLHRQFEANFDIPQLECRHDLKPFNRDGSTGRANMKAEFGYDANIDRIFQEEKGVYWIRGGRGAKSTKKLRAEAISPYYTEYVGAHMMRAVKATEIGEAA